MIAQQERLSVISSWDNYQRFSPLQTFDIPQVGFEPADNLGSGFAEQSCEVVVTKISNHIPYKRSVSSKAAVNRCSKKNSFLKQSTNLQEIFSKFFRKTFLYVVRLCFDPLKNVYW